MHLGQLPGDGMLWAVLLLRQPPLFSRFRREACRSPFGDVFQEYTEKFEEILNQVIEDQGALVSAETEAAKFLSGVKELVAGNPRLIQGKGSQDLSASV
jgi:hypothetical protein